MTDKAIGWVRQQKALMPDKPFFMYYAPGATHAPHHVPPEWADKYKGRFDEGWDALREETFARQKELGVIPADAELTARPAEIPAWDDMPDELKPILARQMEVYAGFLEHTDHHIGRLIDALEELEILDDTLVYFIIGDNGAIAEGTVNGTFNEMLMLQRRARRSRRRVHGRARSTSFGTPAAYNHYAVGWAHAMGTPYQWTKQVASHWGGTRNGTIVHWPNGIAATRRDPQPVQPRHRRRADGPRGGRPAGADVRQRRPADAAAGREHGLLASTTPTRRSATRPSTSRCSCNRGIYHKGWTAVTKHTAPPGSWARSCPHSTTTSGSSTTPDDWTQARDLAARGPRPAARSCSGCSCIEAAKYNVLPARRPSRRAVQRRPRRTTDVWSTATRRCCSAGWDG